jgi:hypothetical protein
LQGKIKMVRAAGFEPAVLGFRDRYVYQFRHARDKCHKGERLKPLPPSRLVVALESTTYCDHKPILFGLKVLRVPLA